MLTHKKFKYLIFFVFTVFFLIPINRTSVIYSLDPLILFDRDEKYSLGLHLEYLEDKTQNLTIQEIDSSLTENLFQPGEEDVPNFGYVKSAYWVHFLLTNPLEHTQRRLLVFKNTTMDYVDIFMPGVEGEYDLIAAGRNVHINNRPVRHRFTIIPVDIVPGETKPIFIRLEGIGMQIPLFVYSPDRFYSEDHNEQLFWGIFIGLMLVMTLYNFFIFLYGRDLSYLYIAMFILSFTMFNIFFFGFGLEYFSFGSNWITDRVHVFFGGGLSAFSALLFCREFLDLKRILPKVYKFYYIMFALSCFMFASVLLTPVSFFLPLSTYVSIIVILTVMTTALLCLNKKSRPARFYLLAWASFLLSMIPFLLKELSLMSENFLTNNSMQIGSSMLVLMLSLAVANKIDTIRKDRDLAQNESDYLQEQDRIKTIFFSNITHEFRTPLTNISTTVDTLISGDYKKMIPYEDPFLQIIRRNCNQSLNLVNTFLSFSRFDEGKLFLDKKPTDIEELVSFYSATMSSSAGMKGITLTLEKPLLENKIIMVDPNLFESAFLNILSNAIKFTDSGGNITITMRDEENNNNEPSISISVKDNGIGIPKEKIGRIFERFYQAEDGQSRKYEGTGLGLPLTKEIVQLHGGMIEVSSTANEGSCFKLILPVGNIKKKVRKAEYTSPEIIKPFRVYEYPLNTNYGGRTSNVNYQRNPEKSGEILLVEDNLDLTNVIFATLESKYNVRTAGNGIDALENLEAYGSPDIIVSDIMMPNMDGRELFFKTREVNQWKNIPFIFLTARASQREKIEALSDGAIDYIYKPFSMEELNRKIQGIISLKKTEHMETLLEVENRVLRAINMDSEVQNPKGDKNIIFKEKIKLTKREKEVVQLIAEGKQDKEIGDFLGLSTRTISNYLHNLYAKYEVYNRIELLNKLKS